MDSYRPGDDLGDGDGDNRTRDTHQRHSGRDRDHDDYYPRAPRHDYRDSRRDPYHDSHYQEYQYGSRYRDSDSEDHHGRQIRDMPYAPRYDEDDGRRGYDRFDSRAMPPNANWNESDRIRYEAQQVGQAPQRRAPPNEGDKDKDINETPNRFLLIQKLKSSTSEHLLAKGLEKLYRGADELEGGAKPLSLRCVMIVRERDTNGHMGYGFAEYHSVAEAKAARKKSQYLDHQCTVSSQKFVAHFPHSGVFPPASVGSLKPTPNKFTFTMALSGRQHKYYDERYYVSEHIVNADPPDNQQDPTDIEASEGSSVPTGSKRGPDTLENVRSKPKKAKKTAGAPEALQRWQAKQTELRDDQTAPSDSISEAQTDDEQTFAVDIDGRKRCYLCNTKFTTSETLLRHLRESETHIAYLASDDRKYRGFERMRKNDVDPDATLKLPAAPAAAASGSAPTADDQPAAQQWRDRAAERRQGEAVSLPAGKIGFSLKPKVPGPSAPSTSPAPPPALGKGRGMLEKFGWKEGEALGDGSGISAPIETSAYAAGVGLGHEGSKRGDAVEEAERRTKGEGGGFLEATRENARKRFEGME